MRTRHSLPRSKRSAARFVLHSTRKPVHGSTSGAALGHGSERHGEMYYCCGPERLMTAVEEATGAWPEGSVHFEWFRPRSRQPKMSPSGSFEVVCQASNLTVTGPPDESEILAALTESGMDLPSSCEQGICGTCEGAGGVGRGRPPRQHIVDG